MSAGPSPASEPDRPWPARASAEIKMTKLVVEAARPLGVTLPMPKSTSLLSVPFSRPLQTISQPRVRPG